MMTWLTITLIAVLTAIVCAIPGVFLVLRRTSMMSDAISHSVLPGIVVAFLIVENRYSPILIAGAALAGVLVVFLTEMIERTRLVKQDAAIGLVFPAMFSIGVILVTSELSNVHFHEHNVLVGDIALASMNSLVIDGVNYGPKSVYVLSSLIIINILFVIIFFKELKITTFDEGLAHSFGFRPILINYIFMTIVSVTAVGAFDAAGSILVIALMIAPGATAYLITNDLSRMLLLSVAAGIISAIAGFWISMELDSSPAGTMAMMSGVIFLAAFLFSPDHGIISRIRKRKARQIVFAKKALLVHLENHIGEPDENYESSLKHLNEHFRWDTSFSRHIVDLSEKDGYVVNRGGILEITDKGKNLVNSNSI